MKSNNSKIGSTLVELCIVIALLAITSTMLITFVMMVSNRLSITNANNDIMIDIKQAETIFDNFISTHDSDDFEVYVTDNVLYITNNTDTYQLSYTDNNIQRTKDDGSTLTYITNSITSITFELSSNSSNKVLIKMIVSTINEKENKTQDFTFLYSTYSLEVRS